MCLTGAIQKSLLITTTTKNVTFQAVAFITGSAVGTTLKSAIGWHGLYYIAAGLSSLGMC